MFRLAFRRQQYLLTSRPLRVTHHPQPLCDGRTPFGQGTRFIQHHGIDVTQILQRKSILNQNMPLGRLPDTDHQGRRRGQPQCTRAGNHQHRNGREQGTGQHTGPAERKPQHKGQQRKPHDRRHEDRTDTVHNALHGGFASLCLLHHLDNAGQHRCRSYGLCLENKGPLLVNRAGQHTVACCLSHGQRFTAYHALIDV